MAQSDSCPNLDLLNGAIVQGPQGICSDLGTQRGREDEEGEEEDEEVELAEEVGEDVLMMMGGGGEGQNEGESREQSEREEVRITQVALLPNEGISEGEGGVETGNKEENGMIDEETRGNEEEDKNTTIENLCQLSSLIGVENGQERDLESNEEEEEDRKDEENTQETELTEGKTIVRDDVLEEYQAVAGSDDPQTVQDSVTVVEETPESSQLTGDTSEAVTVPAHDGVMDVEDSTTVMTPSTTGINEQAIDQDDVWTVSDHGAPFATIEGNQTNQLNTDEDQNSQSSEQEVESIDDAKTRQQMDRVEGRAEDEGDELVKDPTASGDVLDVVVGEADQKVEEAELTFVSPEEQSQQREGGIEETGTEQEVPEEEQVQSEEWGGRDVEEEEGKTGDNVDIEEEHAGRQDLETPEAVLQGVEEEEEPADTLQDVGLDRAEEVCELEKGGEVEPDGPGADATAEERGDSPGHPSKPVEEAGTDVGEQLRDQADVDDETGGGTEEEATEGEAEMADEPVTVLDDGIEEAGESPSREPDEQNPAAVTDPPEDATKVESKGEGCTGNDEKEREGKGEVEKDERPRDDHRELELDRNDKVKGLKQAAENGATSPEPQPPRNEDDERVENRPDEEKAPEVQDRGKELRPVTKDGVTGCERARKPAEKNLPSNDDWIKELKSVIKNESLPRRRDERLKKKRVVLLEDGHSYFPRREETGERREEVKLISHRRAESPLPPVRGGDRAPRDQDYEISLYVKVTDLLNR